jgi:hypothetical protein
VAASHSRAEGDPGELELSAELCAQPAIVQVASPVTQLPMWLVLRWPVAYIGGSFAQGTPGAGVTERFRRRACSSDTRNGCRPACRAVRRDQTGRCGRWRQPLSSNTVGQ